MTSRLRYSRSKKVDPGYAKSTSGRVNKYYGTYIGVVKDNIDSQNMGRLRVWVPEFGSLPNDENSWITVSYCSPFAGATDSDKNEKSGQQKTFESTQTSYGWWAVPPDLENQVLITFINGDIARGFWLGGIYQQNTNKMVPGVASGTTYVGDNLPSAEYNKYAKDFTTANETIKPVAKPVAEGLGNQGLIYDDVRGINTSSARRESPSEVYGLLTPGPKSTVKDGHRLSGHQFVLDDKDGEEKIRLRTRSGAQILLDESNSIVYIINAAGTAWIELSESGHIDVFGKDSISIRTGKDFNLRADRDINLEAGRNVNVTAAKNYTSTLSIPAVNTTNGGNIRFKSYGNVDISTINYNLSSSNNTIITSLGGLHITGTTTTRIKSVANLHLKANNQMNITSTNKMSIKGSTAVFASDGTTDISGTTINLVGSSILRSIPLAGGAVAASPSLSLSATTSAPEEPTQYTKTNILDEFENTSVSSYLTTRLTEDTQSTIKRLITLEPCPEHENTGNQPVNVNRSLD